MSAENNSNCNSKGNSGEQIFCICRTTDSTGFMIICDNCEEWYHCNCVGITKALSRKIDFYCCDECKRKHPELKTTYKRKNSKTKRTGGRRKANKKKLSNQLNNFQATANLEASTDSNTNECVHSFEKNNYAKFYGMTPAIKTNIFDFMDTTTGKKTACNFRSESFRSQVNQKKKQRKTSKAKQCYGPSCTKAARVDSKYCSDDCGLALARNRIIEILPQRIHQWTSTPSAADELSKKKLIEIRSQQQNIHRRLENIEAKILGLTDEIKMAKNPTNLFREYRSEDTTAMHCTLCGTEIQMKSFEKHLEQCYMRFERKLQVTECVRKPNDTEWNVFCNQKIAKNVYCKKLRVLCPMHYKKHRKIDEVCGFPLGLKGINKIYCGNKRKSCCHINWEEMRRAEYDLEKLNLLIKLNKLKNEEVIIRSEMANRGDLLSLLLHQTIKE